MGQNEVVGLLGDNGAGKSSLIKIIAGVHPFDAGEMHIRGAKIDPRKYSVKQAHALGIEKQCNSRHRAWSPGRDAGGVREWGSRDILGIPSIVATLGMQFLIRGFGNVLSNGIGRTVVMDENASFGLFAGKVLTIPV